MRLGQSTLTDAERVTEAKRHIEYLLPRVGVLSPKEARFVLDVSESLKEFGDRTIVTPNQLFWLRDLATSVE